MRRESVAEPVVDAEIVETDRRARVADILVQLDRAELRALLRLVIVQHVLAQGQRPAELQASWEGRSLADRIETTGCSD
jgi:hypothetical protein